MAEEDSMKEKQKIKSKSKIGEKSDEQSQNISDGRASGKDGIAEFNKGLKKNQIQKSIESKSNEERKKKHKAKRKVQNVDFDFEQQQRIQKKRKMEKKKSKDYSSLLQQQETNELTRKKKKDKMNYTNDNGLMQIDEVVEYANKTTKEKKKKHTRWLIESGSGGLLNDGVECEDKEERQNTKPVENGSDEVFPIPGNLKTRKENVGVDGLIRGMRFSPEEDETLKVAVLHYIEKNNLGDEGLEMVLNCIKYPKVKGCWKEIGNAIPYRPYESVYQRVHVLFRRSEARKWTEDEYDLLRSLQKEHGNKWKAIAEELGKHRYQASSAWGRLKLNTKKGYWSQDECQKLFNLVNIDLQAKLSEEKLSQHGMLRDNICWTAISDVLSTRSKANCCLKWYKQLTSRMVRDGVWADKDDYRLIDSLYGLDATCMEDVDWDVLLDNRTGDLCRKRWNQMVLHIGHHRNKPFSEQVEVLAQRYCPFLLEAREAWDNKPRVG